MLSLPYEYACSVLEVCRFPYGMFHSQYYAENSIAAAEKTFFSNIYYMEKKTYHVQDYNKAGAAP